MKRQLSVIVVMIVSAVLASCASDGVSKIKGPRVPPSASAGMTEEGSGDVGASQGSGAGASAILQPLSPDNPPGKSDSLPRAGGVPPEKYVDVPTIRGSENPVWTPESKAHQAEIADEDKLKIQVEKMPVNEFLNLLFGKVLNADYYLDKSLQGRTETVTLSMTTPTGRTALLEIAREVLKSYGLEIQKKGAIYFVGPQSGVAQKQIVPFFVGDVPQDVDSGQRVALFIPIYYNLAPDQHMNLVQMLAVSSEGLAYTIPGAGIIYIVDRAANVRAAAELIRALDRPTLVGKKIRLYYLEYMDAQTFSEHLIQTLPAQGVQLAKSSAERGMILIPLPDVKALLAVSPTEEWLQFVNYWRDKLDIPSILGENPNYFIYYCQNRRATDLAAVFSAVGAELSQVSSNKKKTQPGSTAPAKVSLRKKDDGSLPVSITVDKASNALIIFATPSEFEVMKGLLIELDRLPKQVLIEVTVGEVTLTDKLQFGIEWAIRHSGDLIGELGTLKKLGVGGSGFLYTLITEGGDFQAVLNAFAQKGVLNVLSTPRLMVLDNEEAMINVGTEVPVVTSESTTPGVVSEGTTGILRSIQYRNTGVILNIKPTINSNGMLTITLSQEVSEAQTNDISPDISSPLILTRSLSTSVALKTGSSVLLGGLIKNNTSRSQVKVPLLGDIPILGNVFKTQSKSTDRTEMFIQITPYILSDTKDAEDVTRKFKNLLQMLDK